MIISILFHYYKNTMDTKRIIRRLAPYKMMLFISFLFSGIIGVSLFLLNKAKSMIIIGSLLPMLSSLFQILFLEREFSTLLTTLLILLSVLYYSSYKFFKKSLVAITNFKKERGASYNVFILLLIIATFISIITTQYSLIVKYRIDKKEAPIGAQGRVGERGVMGIKAKNLTSEQDIIRQSINRYREYIFKIALRQRYPTKKFPDDKIFFKNVFMKQAIENAIYSWGFRSILLDLRERYLNNLKNKQNNNPNSEICEIEQVNQNNIIKTLENMMKMEINAWIEIFAKYENGLLFLQSPFLLETSWVTLYTKRDKMNKLPKTPFETLKTREIWLWSQLTKKEYLESEHMLYTSCSGDTCNAIRTINDKIPHYPLVVSNLE